MGKIKVGPLGLSKQMLMSDHLGPGKGETGVGKTNG